MATPPISGIGNAQIILQGVSSGGSAGGATNIPPGILALPNGTLLRGHIVQIEGSGFAVLRTPKGDLTLKTELALRRGSEIIIRLDTALSDIKAKIISVDGLTPREFELTTGGNPAHATVNVEDVIDLPDQPLVAKQPLPVKEGGIPIPLEARVEIADTIEVSTNQPALLRAVLLSRATDLPQLLRLLPANSVFISPQRLDAGATITLSLIPESIQLPTASATTATIAAPASPITSAVPSPVTTASIAAPLPNNVAPTLQPLEPGVITPSAPASTSIAAAPTPAPPSQLAVPSPTVAVAQPGTLPGTTALPASAILQSDIPAPSIQPTITPATITPATITVAPPVSPAPAENAAYAPTAALTPAASPAFAAPTAAITNANLLTPSLTPSLTSPIGPIPVLAETVLPLDSPEINTQIRNGILPAQVIGMEQSGETVLKTPLGTIKMELTAPNGHRLILPPETALQLKLHALEPGEAPLPEIPTNSSSPATLADLTRQWHSLRDMMGLLQQHHPLVAQELIQNTLPKPGATMARDVLFFLSALKSGNTEEWLGKKPLEALEQTLRGDLMRKIGTEFTTLRQSYVESPNPNWQSTFIPVFYEGEWQQLRMFIKKDKPQSSPEKADSVGTRFIMEVDFSRLGPMQFDGFVKKQAQSTLFDLVIRSAQPLPSENQQAIREIFAEAAELTGFKGGLNFQVGQPFPVLPLEEILKSDRNVIA